MNLSKNQSINLAKAAQAIALHFGVNWGMIESGGFLGMGKKKEDVDLDVIGACFDSSGNKASHVYTNLIRGGVLNNGYLLHSGDDLTGDDEDDGKDNEIITASINKIPKNVESIIFSLISFSGQKFDDIPYASVRVYEGQQNNPTNVKAIFNLSNDSSFKGATSIVIGRLCRKGDGWEFEAIGDTSNHRSVDGIFAESKKYA